MVATRRMRPTSAQRSAAARSSICVTCPVTQRDTSLSAGPALRAQEAAEEAAAGRDRTSNAGAPASYSSSASVLFPSAPGTVPSRRRFVIWPVS